VNSSAEVVAEVCPPTVTVISTTPPDPPGLVAVHVVADEQLTEVPGTVPKSTMVPLVENPVPVMVTTVPPEGGPDAGSMAVITGEFVEDAPRTTLPCMSTAAQNDVVGQLTEAKRLLVPSILTADDQEEPS
jgi:hypothetical protein